MFEWYTFSLKYQSTNKEITLRKVKYNLKYTMRIMEELVKTFLAKTG
jgi:hypothetical protein